MPIDNILGIELGETARDKLEKKPLLSRILQPLEFYRSNKDFIDNTYFNEVKQEIKILRKFNDVYQSTPKELIKINKDDPVVWMRNKIKNKYTKDYCPCALFPKKFSRSEKIKYMMFRVEIDNLLRIDNTSYKI